MQRTLLAACVCTLLSVGALNAQMFVGGAPPGAMPLVTAPGPACAVMPAAPASPAAPCMPAPNDPATQGTQVAGKELARAIATVTALPWLDDLDAARLESAATGKPVLWLQALGELDGFA